MKRKWVRASTFRKQNRYLFDIVASLCAGFNEHDIQFLSSLLALLRGDLSAPVKAEGGEGRRDRYGKRYCRDQAKGGRGERNKQSSTQSIA